MHALLTHLLLLHTQQHSQTARINKSSFTMGKKEKVSKAAPKRKAVSAKAGRPLTNKKQNRVTKPTEAERAWKSVFILGEKIHQGAIKNIHQGVEDANGGRISFDFGHFIPLLEALCSEHPDKQFFVFGGSPELQELTEENLPTKNGVYPIPTLSVISVPKGIAPPPFVAIRHFQHGTQEIKSMADFNLDWNHTPSWMTQTLQGRVSILQCTSRMTRAAFKAQSQEDLFKYEYMSLFTMRPSVDWEMEEKDATKLSIRHAMFTYVDADGDEVHEEFHRDDHRMKTFVPDYLERFELDEAEHAEPLKAAIKSAFANARAVKQSQIDLFDGYDADVLDGFEVVKIYPQNDFVRAEHKSDRVNEYYGTAVRVI